MHAPSQHTAHAVSSSSHRNKHDLILLIDSGVEQVIVDVLVEVEVDVTVWTGVGIGVGAVVGAGVGTIV